jgi:hypothetical protein
LFWAELSILQDLNVSRSGKLGHYRNADNLPGSTLDRPKSLSLCCSTTTNLPNVGTIQDPVDIRYANQ